MDDRASKPDQAGAGEQPARRARRPFFYVAAAFFLCDAVLVFVGVPPLVRLPLPLLGLITALMGLRAGARHDRRR